MLIVVTYLISDMDSRFQALIFFFFFADYLWCSHVSESWDTTKASFMWGLTLILVDIFSFLLELMLLGLISLLLAQSARWISEICVNSSLFSSRFYLCSEKDYVIIENTMLESSLSSTNATYIPSRGLLSHQCVEVGMLNIWKLKNFMDDWPY